jgi:hypothetical protein
VKCIMIRCHKIKSIFCHAIPCKGPDEEGYVVKLIVKAIEWMGHVKVILKSDQEAALMATVTMALMALRCNVEDMESVTTEQSAKYDSQANGSTEIGIRAARGMVRTMRSCLEKRIGQKVPVNHPLMSWLVEHVGVLLDARMKGEDGLTPWARARGRPFSHKLFGFGESIHAQMPNKGPQHTAAGNVAPRTKIGTFLGYCRSSNAYRVAVDGSMMETRSLTRRPIQERWQQAALSDIKVTPWEMRPNPGQVEVRLGAPIPMDKPPEDAAVPIPRRLRITKGLMNKCGFSEHCPQCTHYEAFGEEKRGLQHTEACRRRLVEAMRGSDEDKGRVAN